MKDVYIHTQIHRVFDKNCVCKLVKERKTSKLNKNVLYYIVIFTVLIEILIKKN